MAVKMESYWENEKMDFTMIGWVLCETWWMQYWNSVKKSVMIVLSQLQQQALILILLLGQQQGHLVCKKLGVGLLVVMIWL